MPGFSEITCAQLFRLIGTPAAPVLLDVRIADDITADPFTLPCARQVAHTDIGGLIPELIGCRVVVICHRGRKLSHGVAALLRAHGIAAESLAGGMVEWAAANLPRTALAARPAPGTRWVTRSRPKIDRIACPWLIRRFVDPQAQFLYVPAVDVVDVADKFGAIPFDIDGVPYSHRGDACTFDTLLDVFGLQSDGLNRLATVIRGADTDRHDLHPAAAGLLAISVGLSRMYRDDIEQLAAGLPLYDALYRWARDGSDEGHDWVPGAPQ